jgi:hypothetical protein
MAAGGEESREIDVKACRGQHRHKRCREHKPIVSIALLACPPIALDAPRVAGMRARARILIQLNVIAMS